MARSEMHELVEHGIFPANRYARCVDGRYAGNEFGAIATPGADIGFLLNGFAASNKLDLGLKEEEILQALIRVVGGYKNLRFHSDEHAKGHGMGCGHIKHSTTDYESYGITKAQADFVVGILPELLKQGAREEILEGEHQESGVLVVESERFSVKPSVRLRNGIHQSFVYQKTLTDARLQELAKALLPLALQYNPGLTEIRLLSALRQATQEQLQLTVGRLAKDKPVFTAHITPTGKIALA